MMRAAEKGPKQKSIQEISVKIFGYPVKFNVRKKNRKKPWASQKCYSFAAVVFGKNSGALR